MNRTIAVTCLAGWIVIWLCIVVARPSILSDSNEFLKTFVTHDFIEFMGIVVTITLASSANLFIELNKLEEKLEKRIFVRTKREVRNSAYSLIGALVASIVLAVLKPLVVSGDRSQAFVNGLALLVVEFSVLILIDLTVAAFDFEPPLLDEGDGK